MKKATKNNALMSVDKHISLNDWFDIWMSFYKKDKIKKTTLDTYNALYDRHIRYGIGKNSLCDFKPVHIQQVYDEFIKHGYSPRYLNTLHSMMNGLFKTAMINEITDKNPCSFVERPSVVHSSRRVLSRDEQTLLTQYLKSTRFTHIEPAITTMLGTGLRVGELLGLQWSDLSLDTPVKTLSVRRTLVRVKDADTGGSRYLMQTPKTKTSLRIIPLQDSVASALLRQRALQQEYMLRADWEPTPGFTNLVFAGKKGQPQWRSTVADGIDTIVRAINSDERHLAATENRAPVYMEKVLPHSLRHTFATRSLEAGIPAKVVQTWLGHASIKMTLDLYTHVSDDISAEQMVLLEKSMEG